MPNIVLGSDRYRTTVNYIETLAFGVLMFIAESRYGKSILLKNMMVQIGQHRNLIIFDYQDEHSDIKWGNWKSKDRVEFLPELVTIENFGFYLSEFNTDADLIAMGFSSKSLYTVNKIIKNTDVHENSLDTILSILSDLPTSDKGLDDFNGEYPGISLNESINHNIKGNILNTMRGLLSHGLIIPEVGTEEHERKWPGKIHIDDWQQLLRDHKHLNINLNIKTEAASSIARASVGKILEKIQPVLDEIRPFLVLEEAALICPNSRDVPDADYLTSVRILNEYVFRQQRHNVKVAFVTQDPELMNAAILRAGGTWILGKHVGNENLRKTLNTTDFNYERDVISRLKIDKQKGIREFAIMESNDKGHYKIFRSLDSSTRPPHNLNLYSNYINEQKIIPTGRLRKLTMKEIV